MATRRTEVVVPDGDSDEDGEYINLPPSRGGSTASTASLPPAQPADDKGDENEDEDEDDYLTVVMFQEDDPYNHKTDSLDRDAHKAPAETVDTAAVVELLLTCLGCGRRLTSPKLLLCRHTLCLACVKAGVHSDTEVTCWACHKSQPLPSGGIAELSDSPTFVTLLSLAEVKDAAPASPSTGKCDVCEEERPIHKFCPTCETSMCVSCTTSHSKFKETKKHELVSPGTLDPLTLVTSRQRVTCQKHNDEHVTSFCQTCGVMTCNECYEGPHKGHRQDLTSKKAQQVKKVKANLLTSVKRFLKGAGTMGRDLEKHHQDVVMETETLTKKLQDYQQRCTALFTSSIGKLTQDVRKRGERAQDSSRKLLEGKAARDEALVLLRGLMTRLADTHSTSDIDTQALTAFCKRKLSNITTGQGQDANSGHSRHFLPSLALLTALSMTSAGTLVEVGRYPKFATPVVKSSFSICNDPSGLAVTPFGEFLCASYINKSLSLFSATGSLIRDMSADVTLPWGTGVTKDGLLLATECDASQGRPRVKVFSPAGTLLRCLGSGSLASCTGLAVTLENDVAVCDENGPSVCVLRLDGSVLSTYKNDANKKTDYLFEGPMHVAVNVSGDLVVCDDHRVIRIVTQDGRLRAKFPEVEVQSLQNRHFEGVCTDGRGQIIVADSGRKGLHVLTVEGKGRGFIPLPSDLSEPMAVAVIPDNKVAVATREAKLAILEIFEQESVEQQVFV